MKHYGDITRIRGYDVPIVDCVIGGSPCQDLSVAGKRAGLNGERSGLYMEQIRIIKEMRKKDEESGRAGVDIRPRYMLWENVPGAFSSNGGEDFRIVLEEAARIADQNASIPRPANGKWTSAGCIVGDGWSIAWRVLDAQFFGTPSKPLPQRRRRIALVADFGGKSAPEIPFVRESVSGNPQQSGEKRKNTPSNVACSIGTDDSTRECHGGNIGLTLRRNDHFELDKTPTLTTSTGDKAITVIYNANGSGDGLVSPTIVGDHESRVANYTALGVLSTLNNQYVVSIDRASFNKGKNAKFDIGISENGVAQTIVSKGPGAVAYACNWDGTQTSPTLTKNNANGAQRMPDKDNFNCVVQAVDVRNASENDINESLQSNSYHSLNCNNVIRGGYIVRRLTPIECERLQGYPDGWTDIGEWIDTRGKKRDSSDASRYKALGNSIALPQWKWVIKRLCSCYERDATMASLFDGIGGFPFLWEQINGKGSCLWASEIEEFPIAVTNKRINGGEKDG